MTNPRFYCPGDYVVGERLDLPADAAHHASRVLRLNPGDELTLFPGNGGEFRARVHNINKQTVQVIVESSHALERESPLVVSLVQAVSAGDKMDFTLQKAVELGVARITPVLSARAVVKLSAERALKRVAHWRQVVISACEQCGRNRIPLVDEVQDLPNWLQARRLSPGSTLDYLLSPQRGSSLKMQTTPGKPVCLLIGPEGGFTEQEETAAMAQGFIPLRLGPRVLRTETAAPAMLAAMQALWGDF